MATVGAVERMTGGRSVAATVFTLIVNDCVAEFPWLSVATSVTALGPTWASVGVHVTVPETGLIVMPAGTPELSSPPSLVPSDQVSDRPLGSVAVGK